jgi:hypothetical protein
MMCPRYPYEANKEVLPDASLSQAGKRKQGGRNQPPIKARQGPICLILSTRTDALAREFPDTHDMEVKNAIECLAKEYGKLGEPWVLGHRGITGHLLNSIYGKGEKT